MGEEDSERERKNGGRGLERSRNDRRGGITREGIKFWGGGRRQSYTAATS